MHGICEAIPWAQTKAAGGPACIEALNDQEQW
jgi:hypothetical protein